MIVIWGNIKCAGTCVKGRKLSEGRDFDNRQKHVPYSRIYALLSILGNFTCLINNSDRLNECLTQGKERTRVVRSRGLEPPRVLPHSDLNAARLPVPPRPPYTAIRVIILNRAKRHGDIANSWNDGKGPYN